MEKTTGANSGYPLSRWKLFWGHREGQEGKKEKLNTAFWSILSSKEEGEEGEEEEEEEEEKEEALYDCRFRLLSKEKMKVLLERYTGRLYTMRIPSYQFVRNGKRSFVYEVMYAYQKYAHGDHRFLDKDQGFSSTILSTMYISLKFDCVYEGLKGTGVSKGFYGERIRTRDYKNVLYIVTTRRINGAADQSGSKTNSKRKRFENNAYAVDVGYMEEDINFIWQLEFELGVEGILTLFQIQTLAKMKLIRHGEKYKALGNTTKLVKSVAMGRKSKKRGNR
ncbi:hypothetical protein K435DRAFT_813590 [Dendrothele bispora CBS 962.96]|uniref:Uncharacterized protein n=1 Tax=Dendrothele bispora (strain CBS 962.96) TaxID=1314807 RepID=A0A4S8KL55_DENBC|nr:hypothetical protein K435DRAFT_813590 [Dendrothele bispora CBS 962.96]